MTAPEPVPSWVRVGVRGSGGRERTVRFMRAGGGDPLVFLHGWGLTPRAYAPGVLRLCAAGLEVIAPELPGFGASTPLPPRERGLTGYAHHVGRALDRLGLDRPAFVVGHSFGGGVGIALARDRPELVRSLTLLNSVGGAPGRRGLRSGSWLGWALRALGELHPKDLRRLAPTVARDLLPNLACHPGTAAVTAAVALRASLAEDAAALVAGGLPVLFVWGDQDRLIAPGALGTVIGSLPSEIVAGRHGWLMASPEQFGELLRNSLTVHAMLERQARGQALVLPAGSTLADLLPRERRHRARRRAGGGR